VEAQEAGEVGDDYDLRVSAISRASQQVFRNLGVWSGIESRRLCAFEYMHVWDATGDGEIDFDAANLGVDALGHIVENRVTQAALLDRLKSLDGVDWLCPVEVKQVDYQPLGSQLTLADGRVLQGRLLIGADGANSRVRQAAGIELDSAPYYQKAVVCVVESMQQHQHTAWQRFLPTGPLAFLPLEDGRCSIVWSTTEQLADDLIALDDAAFIQQLEQAFDRKLGAVKAVGPRAAFPLIRRHAQNYVKPGLALIGDAAHTIHPLAGQGVNLGILDAASLAEVILKAEQQGQDFASYGQLRKFERWRRGENTLMMFSMSGFKNLFSNEQSELSLLRNLGLNLVNKLSPVKHRFMRHAMGLDGDLPELAKIIGW
ncbi:MAG: UbiH/UbiF/VisC/COQ6 family ubiquinone biosynthesis hydroxylase, partial [Gammaproteobacteria bacterium]|nr:UbiH/UbiF/VisC/COQ6 family ubiquinone biosynthesis hydroxylase [Gammaproteobacteria bacterium]